MITNCDLHSIQYLVLFCKHLPSGRAPTHEEAITAQEITEKTMETYKIEIAKCSCGSDHENP